MKIGGNVPLSAHTNQAGEPTKFESFKLLKRSLKQTHLWSALLPDTNANKISIKKKILNFALPVLYVSECDASVHRIAKIVYHSAPPDMHTVVHERAFCWVGSDICVA